jgi:hypothetical protein
MLNQPSQTLNQPSQTVIKPTNDSKVPESMEGATSTVSKTGEDETSVKISP